MVEQLLAMPKRNRHDRQWTANRQTDKNLKRLVPRGLQALTTFMQYIM